MHVLILGTTGSGKTTLARMIAQTASKARNVIVLDPLNDPEWEKVGASLITDDVNVFMRAAKINSSCHLMIDEAGTFCGQYNKEAFWFATQSRHWGHKAHFISQRATMVSKNIRDNCQELFAFRSSPSDAKLLADDFAKSELLDIVNLNRGECYHCNRFGDVQKIQVFSS